MKMTDQFSPDFSDKWENGLRQTAATFPYPPTPNIAHTVRQRLAARRQPRQQPRLAWAAVLILVLLAGLLAVPSVRAALIEFFQIGDIRLFLATPTATASPTTTATAPPTTAAPTPAEAVVTVTPAIPIPTRSPRPTATSTLSILDLAGETTLAEAEEESGFDINLPTYPADLDQPDHVFYQQLDGPVVIMVWLEPDDEQQPRLTLYALDLAVGAFGGKFDWESTTPATVNDQQAFWVVGAHWLLFFDSTGREQFQFNRFVRGNVLVWQHGNITYRLETNLPLEEAVKIAESIE